MSCEIDITFIMSSINENIGKMIFVNEVIIIRDDRPIGALMSNLQTYGTYTKEMAEEFSRGAMRALLDKSYSIFLSL